MTLALFRADARLTAIAVRKESEGDDKVVAVDLKLYAKVSADVLAEFHPSLRSFLFTETGTIRFSAMEGIRWQGTRRDMDLCLREGPDLKPLVSLQQVTCKKFTLKPLEEGIQQKVALTFTATVKPPGGVLNQLASLVQEQVWIDLNGGAELDLAPPTDAMKEAAALHAELVAKRIEAIEEVAATARKTEAAVTEVRRLQPRLRGAQAKLHGYNDAVLKAAIDAESAAANARPIFISMLQAEIDRRAKPETP